jgi:hypothetical protein
MPAALSNRLNHKKPPLQIWIQMEFLSKNPSGITSQETFLGTLYVQKDYKRIRFLKRYHCTARRARINEKV